MSSLSSSEFDQRTFLRSAMKEFRLTRDGFAVKFGISRRKLDTYLLPPTSKEYRRMDGALAQWLREEVALLRSEMWGILPQGVLVAGLPAVSLEGVACPTVFRRTGRPLVLKDAMHTPPDSDVPVPCQVLTRERSPDEIISYTFRSSVAPDVLDLPALTPIAHLDPKIEVDRWVMVRHHRSRREADAFLAGFFERSSHFSFDMDPCDPQMAGLCEFRGNVFSVVSRPAPNEMRGGLLVYGVEVLRRAYPLFGPYSESGYETWESALAVMTPEGVLAEGEEAVDLVFDRRKFEGRPIYDPEGILKSSEGEGR